MKPWPQSLVLLGLAALNIFPKEGPRLPVEKRVPVCHYGLLLDRAELTNLQNGGWGVLYFSIAGPQSRTILEQPGVRVTERYNPAIHSILVDPEEVLASSVGVIQPGEWGLTNQAVGAWYDVTESRILGRTTRVANLAQIVEDQSQEVCFEAQPDGTLAFYGRTAEQE